MQQYTHENVRITPHLPIYCNQYETYRQMSPSHWHEHLEIIYAVDGNLQITCNDQKHLLRTNEFFVINSNKIHDTRSDGMIKALLIQVPYSYMESYIPDYADIVFQECYNNEKNTQISANEKTLTVRFPYLSPKKHRI